MPQNRGNGASYDTRPLRIVFFGRASLGIMIYSIILFTTIFAIRPVDCDPQRPSYQPLERYLQECGAELAYQCRTTQKALNQACLADPDCVSPATCQRGKCGCPKGFMAYRERCQRAPTLDQRCLGGQCLPPLVCNARDVCDCPTATERINGFCDPKCQPHQILVDGECLKIARLHGKCKSTQQCHTAFSHCTNARCQCVQGTTPSDNNCIATPMCPDGQQPLQTNTGLVRCRSQQCATGQLQSVWSRAKLDSCPQEHYCVFPSYQDGSGFCCPEVPYCPMGQALPGKNCLNPRSDAERCPLDSHHCYVAGRGTACCPLPCPSLAAGSRPVVVDGGLCYERRELNEACNVTAQCPQPAECINGTCGCPEGFDLVYGRTGAKCQRQCPSDTVLVGDECLPLVLPAQDCSHSAQCTRDTKCITGRCACPCGSMFYNGNCVDTPQCPNFGNGAYDPLLAKGSLAECSPANRAPTSPPPCPDQYFCQPAAVYSGGICCPLPEPVCPNGQTPPPGQDDRPVFCDIGSGSLPACPRNMQCYDYAMTILSNLAPNAARRGVCCLLVGGFNSAVSPQPPTWIGGGVYPQTDMCPNGYRQQLSDIGQPLRCPAYAYRGQCGFGSYCIPHPSVAARYPNQEGLCCRPFS